MKLWQKIFLSSLFLIIAAVNIISVTILNNSHRLLVERERTHAIYEHEFFEASFSNAVVYAKLADDKIALNPNEIRRIAERSSAAADAPAIPPYSTARALSSP